MKNMPFNKDRDGVTPVIAIILMVAITVVLTGVLYVWVSNLADTDPGEQTYILFDADVSASTKVLTITMRVGQPIEWGDYQLRMNRTNLEMPANETMVVGDTLEIPIKDEYGIVLVKGEEYRVQLIYIEDQEILWEDTIVCLG
jgi:flagellin-like protein